MRGGRLVDRWDAHEAIDREAVDLAAAGDESVDILRQNAGFLRFCTGIDLDEETERTALFRHFGGDSYRDLVAVDRMDRVEKRNRISDFVRLERTDQVQFEIGESGAEFRPLALGLLDPVLAEDPLPGANQRQNLL